jgi:cell division protease FtsH
MLPGQIKPSLSFRKLLGFLKNPDNYSALGAKTLCWYELLEHKRHCLRGMSGVAGVPFFSCAASELVELGS